MKFNTALMESSLQSQGLSSKDPATLMATKAKAQNDPDAIEEVAKQFESIFMHQVFKSMRQTLPKEGMMSGGFGEDVFTDMLDQEYAGMATQNQSMGLAATIAEQLGGSSSGLETALAPKALRQLKASQAYAQDKTSGQWTSPVQADSQKPFGMHRAPSESRAHFHDGIDFISAEQTPVVVSRAGLISSVKSMGADRYEVQVDHGDGFVSSYEGVKAVQVKIGDPVEQGAELGTTSTASTRHDEGLHFEIQHRGRSIDPGPLLNQ
jgi:murein DD-endopeptidase MepM/ murein hydrolase activator NlpD